MFPVVIGYNDGNVHSSSPCENPILGYYSKYMLHTQTRKCDELVKCKVCQSIFLVLLEEVLYHITDIMEQK
jgi:hypothetical protein